MASRASAAEALHRSRVKRMCGLGTDILSRIEARRRGEILGLTTANRGKHIGRHQNGRAPLVAGCARCARILHATTRACQAQRGVLKATLSTRTRKLPGADAVTTSNRAEQAPGFGVINAVRYADPSTATVRVRRRIGLRGQLHRHGDGGATTSMGGRHGFALLVWTDDAGTGLHNNLNLWWNRRQQKVAGNETTDGSRPVLRRNNVEIVRVDAPAAGKFDPELAATVRRPDSPGGHRRAHLTAHTV